MKTFTRIKKIGGNEYLYEVTPYYDPITGKIRQRSRYLGKKDETGVAITPSSRRQTSRVLSCGEYLPFLGTAEELGFRETLEDLLPPRDVSTIMSLAISLAAHPGSFTSLQDWYDWTAVSLVYPDADMRPAKLLQIIQNISDVHILDRFTAQREDSEISIPSAGLALEVIQEETSAFLKDYSPAGGHPSPEYYLIRCDPETGIVNGACKLPETVRARLNPGTLQKTLPWENTPVVYPLGCIPSGHLRLLADTEFPFVLPVPPLRVFSDEDARSILKAVLADSNFRTLEDEGVFIKASPINIGSRVIPGFIVLNGPSERLARVRHHREMFRLMEDLRNITIPPGVRPEDIIRDIARDLAPFVTWTPDEKGGRAQMNRDAMMLAIMEAGMQLILHRGSMQREECLDLLSARRTFNDILTERLGILCRMMETEARERMFDGILFITILSSAIRWRLEKKLPLVKGKGSISIDALMGTLCTITITTGPGRRRNAKGAIPGQKTTLASLQCLPDQVISGCSPLPDDIPSDQDSKDSPGYPGRELEEVKPPENPV